jgi:hypothetical protein
MPESERMPEFMACEPRTKLTDALPPSKVCGVHQHDGSGRDPVGAIPCEVGNAAQSESVAIDQSRGEAGRFCAVRVVDCYCG